MTTMMINFHETTFPTFRSERDSFDVHRSAHAMHDGMSRRDRERESEKLSLPCRKN
jgi:hypothetical protein